MIYGLGKTFQYPENYDIQQTFGLKCALKTVNLPYAT
jgi:hypothetical protein